MKRQSKSQKAIKLLEDYPTYDAFCVRYNPANQMKLALSGPTHVKCFQYEYPTLSVVASAYSEKAVINWLKIQFENLNDFVGAKEKMTFEQLEEVATLIYSDCWYLNISEVFLFFIQLKSGVFCEFYGFIDPLKIMKAKNEFISNRAYELRRHDEIIKKQQDDLLREQRSKTAITYEEYKRIRKHEIRLKIRNLIHRKIIRRSKRK